MINVLQFGRTCIERSEDEEHKGRTFIYMVVLFFVVLTVFGGVRMDAYRCSATLRSFGVLGHGSGSRLRRRLGFGRGHLRLSFGLRPNGSHLGFRQRLRLQACSPYLGLRFRLAFGLKIDQLRLPFVV